MQGEDLCILNLSCTYSLVLLGFILAILLVCSVVSYIHRKRTISFNGIANDEEESILHARQEYFPHRYEQQDEVLVHSHTPSQKKSPSRSSLSRQMKVRDVNVAMHQRQEVDHNLGKSELLRSTFTGPDVLESSKHVARKFLQEPEREQLALGTGREVFAVTDHPILNFTAASNTTAVVSNSCIMADANLNEIESILHRLEQQQVGSVMLLVTPHFLHEADI
jgi:hypothetical protein